MLDMPSWIHSTRRDEELTIVGLSSKHTIRSIVNLRAFSVNSLPLAISFSLLYIFIRYWTKWRFQQQTPYMDSNELSSKTNTHKNWTSRTKEEKHTACVIQLTENAFTSYICIVHLSIEFFGGTIALSMLDAIYPNSLEFIRFQSRLPKKNCFERI